MSAESFGSKRSVTAATARYLTPDDQQQLLAGAQQIAYRRGDVLLTEGVQAHKLFLIRQGYVRVEHTAKGQGIAVARLGPGQVVGEMGFLAGTGATASVIADEDVLADVVEGAHLEALLHSNPGFASRFYQSLAVAMAERLGKTTHDWALSQAQQQAAWKRSHLDRTLQLSERQLPGELVRGVMEFQRALQAVDHSLAAGQLEGEGAQARVNAACDHLRDLVERFTQPAALVEIGYDDTLNFRTPEQLAQGVGIYVLRETFPLLMTSATMARCYKKPHGYAEDGETLERIYENEPEGDGRLGGYLDRWFLSGPVCQARREGRRQLAEQLGKAAATVGAAGPFHVTSLVCGAAEELFDFLGTTQAPVYATCLDSDADTLEATAGVARDLEYGEAITFVQADAIGLISGRGAVSVGDQHLIYAQGLGDYLDDPQFVQLLDWIFKCLQDGGVLALAGLDLAHADQAFLQHILEWEVHPRSEARLRELVSKSRFRDHPLEVLACGGGAFLTVRR